MDDTYDMPNSLDLDNSPYMIWIIIVKFHEERVSWRDEIENFKNLNRGLFFGLLIKN